MCKKLSEHEHSTSHARSKLSSKTKTCKKIEVVILVIIVVRGHQQDNSHRSIAHIRLPVHLSLKNLILYRF